MHKNTMANVHTYTLSKAFCYAIVMQLCFFITYPFIWKLTLKMTCYKKRKKINFTMQQ